MIYQIRANLFFHDQAPVSDIMDKILDHFEEATVVNPHTDNQELSTLDLTMNHHDEDPNQPCTTISSIDNHPLPPE